VKRIIGISLAALLAGFWMLSRQTQERIEADAVTALPVGTDRGEVERYFVRADSVHWIEDERYILAVFRNVTNTVIIEEDVAIFVHFDQDMKVRQVTSRKAIRGVP